MLKGVLSLTKRSIEKASVSIAGLSLILSLGAGTTALAGDTAFAIVSSKGNYWKPAAVTEGSGSATVTIGNQKKQKWHGFAGCFNEAGWDALGVLDSAERDRAIRLLFDKKDGIGFPWGRIPIGASDYALDRYTLDDAPGDDFTMQHFSINRDKGCLIKFIKAAQAVKPDIKFWASPWTPPPWMKKNTLSGGDGFDGGLMRNEPTVFEAHALYFSKFIQAYTSEGIEINAVCPQNEPGYLREYPTCGWGKYNSHDGKDVDDPEYLSTFVAEYLAPKLGQDHPGTEIWFGTLSNNVTAPGYWNGMKQKLGQNVKNVIKGLGLQWNNVTMVKANATEGYFVFCSEHQCGNYYWLGDQGKLATGREDANRDNFLKGLAPNNHAYGEESWDLFKKWIDEGVHLYSAWNMVLDSKGLNLNRSLQWPQNALLAVDRTAKFLEVTPYYYVMRHIAQYVDTGASYLGGGSNAMAFVNPDGGIATVVSNTGGQTDMTISVGGKTYKFTHPGKGWATLYTGPWPPAWYNTTKGTTPARLPVEKTALKVFCKAGGYRIALPSREAGRIELLTVSGRVLGSGNIPQGSREITLPSHVSHTGMLLVRVVYGNRAHTARLVNY